MEKLEAKTIVVGVGNILLKDEGVGVHVARALQEMTLPADTEVLDGGTSPDLPYYLNGADKLVIIDAVKGEGRPGTVYRFRPCDVNVESAEMVSIHELGLEQTLKIMGLMGREPKEIVIIGIEPGEIDWGTEPSAALQQKIPEIVNIVLEEINNQESN